MMVRPVVALPSGVALLLSLSCSDPPNPPAQAAITTTVNTVAGEATCGATHGELVLPTGNASFVHDELIGCNARNGCKPDQYVVVDRDDGASVVCSVTPTGTDQFNVNLLIAAKTLRFQVNGIINKGGGNVTINENVGTKNLTNPSDAPCTLQIVQNATGAFGQVKAGAVWAHFSCPKFADPSDPGGGVCAADGAFIFENCDS